MIHRLRGSAVGTRLLGFSTLSLLAAIGPLVLLPLVARLSGPSEWAALGVGQSVGTFLALPVMFGWNLVGPVRVARASETEASALYRQSMVVRVLSFVLCLPIALVAAWILSPTGSEVLGVVTAVSMMLVGLSPAWFCVGAGRPAWLAAYDVGPRVVSAVAAIPFLLLTRSVFVYPLILGVGSAVGVLAFTWRHRPREDERWPSLRQGFREIVVDVGPAATVTIAGAYSAAPVAIASAVLPVGPLAQFVSAERIYRFALVAVSTLSDSVQGWVSEVRGAHSRHRGMRALAAHAVLGGAGLVLVTGLGPFASRVLFGRGLEVGHGVFFGFGLAFLAIALNTSLGKHILVPSGMTGFVLASTVVGAVCGVTSIALFGRWYGATGAAAAFAVSEIAVTAVQAGGILFARRSGYEVKEFPLPEAVP